MTTEPLAYGLWPLVIINAAIFIIFAFSFTRPSAGRDWRSFGAFAAFIVALFTEMYSFPLTIYLLSGRLGSQYISYAQHTTAFFPKWGSKQEQQQQNPIAWESIPPYYRD